MMAARYAIADEPRPSAIQGLVVDPMWPLLAVMMAGGLVGFGWLILNSFAVGSSTRWKETLASAAGYVGATTIVALLSITELDHGFPSAVAPYVVVVAVTRKLAFAYWVSMRQYQSIELFEYFGGAKRNGLVGFMLVLIILAPTLVGVLRSYGIGALAG